MNSINNYILEAVDIVVDSKLSELEFNKTIEGVIDSNVDENNYNIKVNNTSITAQALAGHSFNVGDVVIVLVLNNNYSNKIILGKR